MRLPAPLVYRLRAHLAAQEDQDSTALVFTNRDGNPLEYGNLLRRHLKPLVEEVNASWAGFHTFRHTFASLHLSRDQPPPAQPRPRPSLGRIHGSPATRICCPAMRRRPLDLSSLPTTPTTADLIAEAVA